MEKNRNSELLIRITDMKHLQEGLKSRLKLAEEWINKLEDRAIEIIQSEEKKETRINTNNRPLENCATPTSIPTYA